LLAKMAVIAWMLDHGVAWELEEAAQL
jgi:hypothetical protein